MEKTLPIILSELRKAKGISQKEASAKLGISQALLSHYEKGIRECGLGFLVRAADFYGVSCDYLLGRTSSPSGLNDAPPEEAEDEETDNLPIIKTFLKATAQLKDFIYTKDGTVSQRFNTAYALQLYKTILLHADSGFLPKSWAGNAFDGEKIFGNTFYLSLVDAAEKNALTPEFPANFCEDDPVPDAVKTVVAFAEDFIHETLKEKLPHK